VPKLAGHAEAKGGSMSFLVLDNIYKVFKNASAVEAFNLSVKQGEFISFLGPSGCGKTTTLRMVAGFETPTSGHILINGIDITFQPPNQRNVGMVFQSYALFPNLTVAENIGFGLMIARKNKEMIKQRVNEMLNLIHLPNFDKRYPYQLSGGQQQRVALARALAFNPQILLLDEPLSALDAKNRIELRSEIRRIQQELGITTIYVTHDQEEALSISDKIVVMNGGKIEQIGNPFDIYNYPQTPFVAAFVGQLNQFQAEIINSSAGQCILGGQVIQLNQSLENHNQNLVHLAIRPEEMNLGHIEGNNNLHGEVLNATFLGSIVRLRVSVSGIPLALDLFNERKFIPPCIGENVTVNFPAHACWVIE
jgi:putative spermidine/putrescine transport system ATP-binding protein